MPIYCDTHVHCYRFSEFEDLLTCAYQNVASQSFSADNDVLVLFFTDGRRDKTWSKLKAVVEQGGELKGWVLEASKDANTLVAKNLNGEQLIYLMAARQINSIERLEFLILGYDGDDEDGATADSIINQFSDQFMVISPWGVGKWLFARSKILTALLEKYPSALYLGDNGGRPSFWRWVSHFNKTKQFVLNGSDPLPIADEIKRVASFGLCIEVDAQLPLSSQEVISYLKDKSIAKTNYGKPLALMPFIKGRLGLAKS